MEPREQPTSEPRPPVNNEKAVNEYLINRYKNGERLDLPMKEIQADATLYAVNQLSSARFKLLADKPPLGDDLHVLKNEKSFIQSALDAAEDLNSWEGLQIYIDETSDKKIELSTIEDDEHEQMAKALKGLAKSMVIHGASADMRQN